MGATGKRIIDPLGWIFPEEMSQQGKSDMQALRNLPPEYQATLQNLRQQGPSMGQPMQRLSDLRPQGGTQFVLGQNIKRNNGF